MKKNVLISGVGGSLFPYLIYSLENKYNLILIDVNEVIKKIYSNQNVIIVPLVNDINFETEIGKIIEIYKIEYYIPLIDEEIPKTFSFLSKFKELKLICPNKKFVELCLNKYNLMNELERKNISKVSSYLASDFNFEIKFPVLFKPNMGRGSRGVRKIDNLEQYNAYFELEHYEKSDIIVQEFLDGTEYTVSVVVNNKNILIAVVPKRILRKRGITISAKTEKNDKILEVCKEIVFKFKPHGPFNVQLKIIEDSCKIFEINPRFSTTSILTCEAGINEFELCIDLYNKEDIKFIDKFKENLYIYRRWESLFYD